MHIVESCWRLFGHILRRDRHSGKQSYAGLLQPNGMQISWKTNNHTIWNNKQRTLTSLPPYETQNFKRSTNHETIATIAEKVENVYTEDHRVC
ncbi:hypothetical protein ElyMa_006201400 [Elysia marginata]|uniref:Uncharacterized protein n=1 Tax=Elysia marginata TaxID=1093978 RepID=A0AAV4H2P7_9GAST|nr:hypothetical protein ElyMa_006201400 [Elysia marginata]